MQMLGAGNSWSSACLLPHQPIRRKSRTLQPPHQILPIETLPWKSSRGWGWFLTMSHPFSLLGPAINLSLLKKKKFRCLDFPPKIMRVSLQSNSRIWIFNKYPLRLWSWWITDSALCNTGLDALEVRCPEDPWPPWEGFDISFAQGITWSVSHTLFHLSQHTGSFIGVLNRIVNVCLFLHRWESHDCILLKWSFNNNLTGLRHLKVFWGPREEWNLPKFLSSTDEIWGRKLVGDGFSTLR